MRETMKIEQLADQMILKVLKNFNIKDGDIKDFVLKFGHDEDKYSQELKWDLHFNDSESAKCFIDYWNKECDKVMQEVKVHGKNIKNYAELWTTSRGTEYEFPLMFEICDEEDSDYVVSGWIHWDPEDKNGFKRFMHLILVASKTGYPSLGDINKDKEVALYRAGAQWGELELTI